MTQGHSSISPSHPSASLTHPSASPTLAEVQRTVDEWIRGTGCGYFSELTNAVILAEETGEVARVMARTYGDQKAKPGDKSSLADELADLLWVLTAIANQAGIDLSRAFADNLKKKNLRDKERFQSVASKPD